MSVQNQSQESKPETIIPSAIGPGMRLQEARVKLGLSVEDVASRLCLRVKVIESLEADHYSDFAGLVFTRGYLRAYARFVGLDAGDIISIFNGLGVKEKEVIKPVWDSKQMVGLTLPKGINRQWLMVAGLSIVVAAAAVWGYRHLPKHLLLGKSVTKTETVAEFKPLQLDPVVSDELLAKPKENFMVSGVPHSEKSSKHQSGS